MRLMDFISRENVAPDIKACDKEELLTELVGMLHTCGKIGDPAPLVKSLLEREKIMTTGIGRGIAVPHAISPEVKEQMIILGRVPGGAEYESLDRAPVYFVFLLVGPPEEASIHLKTLARISRLIQHTNFVDAIKKAVTADDILKILAEEDGKHTG